MPLPRRGSFCNLMTLQAFSRFSICISICSSNLNCIVSTLSVCPCTTLWSARTAHGAQAASWQQGRAAAHPQAAWPRCVSTHSTGSPLRVTTRSLSSAVACKKVACPCCCPIFRLRGHAPGGRLSPCPRCSRLNSSAATLSALQLQRANAALFDACAVGPLNASEVQRGHAAYAPAAAGPRCIEPALERGHAVYF